MEIIGHTQNCFQKIGEYTLAFEIIYRQIVLIHGRTRTNILYRCVWSGITGR